MVEDRVRDVEQRVTALVVQQAGRSDVSVTRDTHFVDDLNFDSLDLVELTMSLEEEFELSIPDGEAVGLTTVGAVIDYVVERTKDAPATA
jgi:acyl carrier protein